MSIEYSYTVSWGCHSCTATSSESMEDAEKAAWDFALQLGYRNPRWWEFWRFSDSRPLANYGVRKGEP